MPLSPKSRRKLEAFAEVRALDSLAIPLFIEFGVEKAYLLALDILCAQAAALEGRSPCGRRLEEFGGAAGSNGRDLAGVQGEGSTRVTEC